MWWDLTWGKDVLERGGRCADANHRRAREGRADHDGTSRRPMTERVRGELRCRGTSRAVAAILSHPALAVGAEIRG